MTYLPAILKNRLFFPSIYSFSVALGSQIVRYSSSHCFDREIMVSKGGVELAKSKRTLWLKPN